MPTPNTPSVGQFSEEVEAILQRGDENTSRFNLTDYGNAERLVRDHGNRIRFSPERKAWLIWTGKVWEWDLGGVKMANLAKKTARNILHEAADEPDEKTRDSIIKHSRDSERQVRIEAMIKSAESEHGIAIRVANLDANNFLLNVANGTIDLQTGKLKPHDPLDLITELIRIDYEPSAKSEEWDKFINRIFNEDSELVGYVKRALGYSITGDTTEQAFFFCYGSGANGKSTLLGVCRSVLKGYTAEITPNAFMVDKHKHNGPNEEIAALYNKRLVCSTELEDGQKLSTSLIKRMTGGESITSNRKYEHEFEFFPTHKLWLCGNHQPVITDSTDSIWRRLKKIPFTVRIPDSEKRKDLAAQLVAHHSQAILSWLVQGCVQWFQAKDLKEPQVVKQAVKDYQDNQDTLHDYLAERCVFQKSAVIFQAALYRDYKNWAENNDVVALGTKTFRDRITEKGCASGRGTGNKATWQGIRVLAEGEVINPDNPVNLFTEKRPRVRGCR